MLGLLNELLQDELLHELLVDLFLALRLRTLGLCFGGLGITVGHLIFFKLIVNRYSAKMCVFLTWRECEM